MDPEIAKTQEERKKMEQQLASLTSLTFDRDLYGGVDREAYETSIPATDDEEPDMGLNEVALKLASYTAPKSVLKEMPRGGDGSEETDGFRKPSRIIDREDDYRRRRLDRIISPERHDPFSAGEKTPDPSVRTYSDVMKEESLKKQKEELLRKIANKKKEEEEARAEKEEKPASSVPKRSNRWDQSKEDDGKVVKKAKTGSDWDLPDATPGIGRWDATPTPGRIGDATPGAGRRNRWDETPTPGESS
ncbi:SPLICING FACTOR 3B SUBUNIT 1-RELATED [Salix purpurea]|uniref:SPLICING FACTOR 3B SUBUNIT 1-RELATED n=1 Tax=Salix purpurea TaxID=77065 RepID=A0A9Q0VTG0_SALPP|nr:SPLICING FACTOR 3B SUBUNIT 1-RELATED [Salix purpurea]